MAPRRDFEIEHQNSVPGGRKLMHDLFQATRFTTVFRTVLLYIPVKQKKEAWEQNFSIISSKALLEIIEKSTFGNRGVAETNGLFRANGLKI
jgi:hypothetical protein